MRAKCSHKPFDVQSTKALIVLYRRTRKHDTLQPVIKGLKFNKKASLPTEGNKYFPKSKNQERFSILCSLKKQNTVEAVAHHYCHYFPIT